MDIFGAQSHMKKLLAYVEKISKSDAHVYAKSRTRLKDLYDTCNHIEDLISSMLEDDMFEQSENEFAGLDVIENNSYSELDNKDKKLAFKLYCEILEQTSLSDLNIDKALDCSKLIWYWFNHRFILSKDTCPGFLYNMNNFPAWIQSIVLCYGKSIEELKDVEFTNDVRCWCDDLVTKGNNNYPLPVNVNIMLQSDCSNLTSVVLWDILMNNGYDSLCNKHPKEVYLSEDSIYNYCGKQDPSVLDDYVQYDHDPSILDRCNLGRR